ncbi:MAG TPA: glycerol kinase GlpK [Terracidiphilus sp.]|nr:glycerol kinase GlpK [Terracidiphilus sp.]HUX27979.1 glycerol kinase GlpK [Terracidiphilus sp.]
MANELILAIDQGTTNTKALLVDRDGHIVFRASVPLDLVLPGPGYVEQDPLALWQSVCHVMDECVRYAASHDATISGIAITNQRETSLAWHRAPADFPAAGEPLSNAISWQCRRSAPVCDRLRPHASSIQAVTGLPLDPLLSATKWAWMLEHQPELRTAADAGELLLGTVDSWLLYNLTGGSVHATDHTNASRTALLSLQTLDWDDGLLTLFGIPRTALPQVRPSSFHFGECSSIPGLAGVPIVSIIGDSHAAIVGHGCYQPGTVKATYGTGSSLMMLTPSLVGHTSVLARTVAWSSANQTQFALEGNIAMSGAALQWVGEFLGLPHPTEDAAALAETVPDAAGVILVPAMVGLGAPHWDSAARGLIANLERSHTAAHLARAATDAIAFQVADVLEAMEQAAGVALPVLLADGGATRNNTIMQMQADILDRPVHRSTQEDLSALGAAMLAGLALGWWKLLNDLAALPRDFQPFHPNMPAEQRHTLRESWRLAVRRARLQPEVAS